VIKKTPIAHRDIFLADILYFSLESRPAKPYTIFSFSIDALYLLHNGTCARFVGIVSRE
jgi:hypothetical protein